MHPVYESSSTLWRARKNPKVGQSSLISNFVKTICSIRHDVSEGYDSILFSWVDIKFLWWLLHRHYGSFFQFNAIFQGFRCKLLFVTCLHFFQISSRDCWLVVICLHFKSRSLIGWSLFTFLTERNLIGLQNRSCFLFHFWEFFFFIFQGGRNLLVGKATQKMSRVHKIFCERWHRRHQRCGPVFPQPNRKFGRNHRKKNRRKLVSTLSCHASKSSWISEAKSAKKFLKGLRHHCQKCAQSRSINDRLHWHARAQRSTRVSFRPFWLTTLPTIKWFT